MRLIGSQAAASFGSDIAMQQRQVAAPLRTYFSTAWRVQVPCGDRPLPLSMLPDGCAELVWLNGALFVFGPSSTAYLEVAAPGTATVAMRFRLGAAPPWLGVRASDIVDNRVPLERLDRRLAVALAEAVGNGQDGAMILARLETALMELTRSRAVPKASMRAVLRLLPQEGLTEGRLLHALKESSNLSERTVRRETERCFGFGPKMLERIARLQHFLHLAKHQTDEGIAWLATQAGYADQPHLTREARDLTGMTPKTLVALCRERSADLLEAQPRRLATRISEPLLLSSAKFLSAEPSMQYTKQS